ncbi:MAG: pseudouridine synthase, partial [Alistipes finegoldii]
HFTEDNRPAFDKPRRSFGDERQGDRARSDERYRDGDKPRRSFGDKPRGEKPAYGDNRGPKKFGDRKFGDKPYGERKSGDKPAGDRRFADKSPAIASSATNPTANVIRRQARRRPSVRGQKSGDRRFGDKP